MSYMAVLTFKAVNPISRHYNDLVSDQLPDLEDKKSMTLCWHSFSELDVESVTSCCAYEGILSVTNECL
jgi:hypothetical protein